MIEQLLNKKLDAKEIDTPLNKTYIESCIKEGGMEIRKIYEG